MTEYKLKDLNDDEIFEKLYKEEISRNKNYEFFKTERVRHIHEQVKLLKGILKDIKNGSIMTDVEKKDSSYILKIERKELSYIRTVILSPVQYKFFQIETNKSSGGI